MFSECFVYFPINYICLKPKFDAIDEYINFYNTKRLQKRLKGITPRILWL
ncbi:IS3 family transposase [Clostridium akagii]